MIIIIGICVAIIIFLIIKLQQKQQIDTEKYYEFKNNCEKAKNEFTTIQERITEAEQKYTNIINEYQKITETNQNQLDEAFEAQRSARQAELDAYFDRLWQQEEQKLELKKSEAQKANDEFLDELSTQTVLLQERNMETQARVKKEMDAAQQKLDALLEPLKQYEKDKLEKLFYTIQLPEEFQEDIEFLLTTVAAKVQHPDIISKLVWTEYVKPNLDNTFKRIEIKPEAGIYKLTSLETGMSYIGKSTNVKNRIADHFKSAVGLTTISDQAVHHAIRKEGFWNWSIEIIIYCDKDKLGELEKYYIEFFKTQEYGYNKRAGG